MQPIGIIANPASGKDIRRLVAYGSVFDNNEKVNIVRRILLGLESVGARYVWFMPDTFGIGVRALEDLEADITPHFLEMEMEGDQDDTTLAAKLLDRMDAACIITLGGDGTNRAAAKACGTTPLLPLSTGTNNVFPSMMESTLAGIAAGLLAGHPEYNEACLRQRPRLVVRRDGRDEDMALVDVVVTRGGFIASRALWDVSSLCEVFLAHSEAGHIGFSSIGGHLGLGRDGHGVHIQIGPGETRVKAPIAPGLVRSVPIQSCRLFEPDEEITIAETSGLIALDGEREITIKAGEQWSVALDLQGPRVLDIASAFSRAAAEGVFMETVKGG